MTLESQTAEVRIRTNWGDDWSAVIPYLYADRTEFVAGPKLASAEISYRYGQIMRPDEQAFFDYTIQEELSGQFVWIKQENGLIAGVPQFKNWYGIIASEIDKQDGNEIGPAGDVASGVQRFTCLGMGTLLDRIFISQSEVLIDDTNKTVERAIGFNLGPRNEFLGNRSTVNAPLGAPLFANVLTESAATTWSTLDIIRYLFAFFSPVDNQNNQVITFNITGQTAELANVIPLVDPERRSVKRILDQLIDRRRLYGYTIEVDGDTNEVNVRVFTYTKDEIDLPSGAIVPANDNQGNLNDSLRERSTLLNVEVAKSDTHQYERIVARGERATVTFSLSNSFSFDNLEEDWSAALETEYETGASGIGAAYNNADQAVQIELNKAVRQHDNLARVWRYFRVPPDWNFLNVNATGLIFPTDDQDKNVWFPGLRFSDRLALLTDHDYSAAAVNGQTPVTDNTPADSQAESLKPFVVMRRNQSDPFQWEFSDKLVGGYGETDNRSEEAQTGGIPFSASLRMQDGALGIIVSVIGAAQHAIARGDFTPTDASDTAADQALLKWEEMIATVTMELDWFAESSFPLDPQGAFVQFEKTLVVTVPGKRADWLADETVLDVDTDATLIQSSTTAGYIKDDRDDLGDIARSAFRWYSTTRSAATWTDHRGDTPDVIGQLILSLGNGTVAADDVNTVVTSVSFDLVRGNHSVVTQAADIDFGGL